MGHHALHSNLVPTPTGWLAFLAHGLAPFQSQRLRRNCWTILQKMEGRDGIMVFLKDTLCLGVNLANTAGVEELN